MKSIVVAAAFILASADAQTSPPKLFGYYPSQPLAEAQAIDSTRSLEDCSYKGIWKCISFKTDIFGDTGNVDVQLTNDQRVARVSFHVMGRMSLETCAKVGAATVGGFSKQFGAFSSEEPGKTYNWDIGDKKFSISIICINNVGAVIGVLDSTQ